MKSENLVFVALAFFVVGICYMAFSSDNKIEREPLSMPYFNSVVVEDGRSVCEKKADLYFIRAWNRTCVDSKQEPTCDLYPEAVKPLYTSRNIVLGNCLRPLST